MIRNALKKISVILFTIVYIFYWLFLMFTVLAFQLDYELSHLYLPYIWVTVAPAIVAALGFVEVYSIIKQRKRNYLIEIIIVAIIILHFWYMFIQSR